MQLQDENKQKIIERVNAGSSNFCYGQATKNDKLFRKINDKHLWVVLKSVRDRVMQQQHNNADRLTTFSIIFGLRGLNL